MSIYESMRAEADANFARIGDLSEYPSVLRGPELHVDPGYYGRVLVAYGAVLGDGEPDFRRVDEGRYLPDDVLLMGIVESRVIEGDEVAVLAHPVAKQGFATDQAQFDEIAAEATGWVYYGGGPGARLLVPSDEPGKTRLYERSQVFVVPELDDHNEPTGQFVGVRSNNVPSLQSTEPKFDPDDVDPAGEGLGSYVDMPEVDETISRQFGVAPWAGNVVVPALVVTGMPHVELGHGVVSTRKIELAWYYRPSGEQPEIPTERIAV